MDVILVSRAMSPQAGQRPRISHAASRAAGNGRLASLDQKVPSKKSTQDDAGRSKLQQPKSKQGAAKKETKRSSANGFNSIGLGASPCERLLLLLVVQPCKRLSDRVMQRKLLGGRGRTTTAGCNVFLLPFAGHRGKQAQGPAQSLLARLSNRLASQRFIPAGKARQKRRNGLLNHWTSVHRRPT
ncbi:hypothetical protein TEQG_04363 [Trichophyton equinum CBS 127.97]|uniref:Uncharacterized protein n=1 Tax=Trichophyton equinum (strain ATCC MYA-4606 / CBS 127.97) TaxID=559882 RepID=F2PTI7_TRIEC|nr:hypothetical protein TEQG_04363 [Trichophyton equinum CBS 127.97]